MEEESTTKPEPVEHDQEKDETRGYLLRWLRWISISFSLYLLSIGPAAKISIECNLPAKYPTLQVAAEVIYTPITAVMQHYLPAERVVMWYIVKVWRVPLLHY